MSVASTYIMGSGMVGKCETHIYQLMYIINIYPYHLLHYVTFEIIGLTLFSNQYTVYYIKQKEQTND